MGLRVPTAARANGTRRSSLIDEALQRRELLHRGVFVFFVCVRVTSSALPTMCKNPLDERRVFDACDDLESAATALIRFYVNGENPLEALRSLRVR